MCEPTTLAYIAGGLQLAQGVAGYQQARAQGKYQQAVAEQNARAQEQQAQDARARGVVAGEEQRDRARQVGARQATGLAASGLDISSGTSLDLFAETATLGEYDAQVAENNAYREAFGFQTRAAESRASGRNARQAGRNRAFGTLLTSGASAANSFSTAYGG
ncbi:hypothetical protein ACFQH5_15670 [Halomonas salifodinae]|uniref:Phage protein n=1 Tax=Halomonas salifodinae TaxID=438745 RepID=A0ABW2F1A8_9GAMM